MTAYGVLEHIMLYSLLHERRNKGYYDRPILHVSLAIQGFKPTSDYNSSSFGTAESPQGADTAPCSTDSDSLVQKADNLGRPLPAARWKAPISEAASKTEAPGSYLAQASTLGAGGTHDQRIAYAKARLRAMIAARLESPNLQDRGCRANRVPKRSLQT